MTSRLIPAFVLLASILAGPAASAADAQCVADCDAQEEQCSADANDAIFNGTFSGHECSGYNACASQIQSCRAEQDVCRAKC